MYVEEVSPRRIPPTAGVKGPFPDGNYLLSASNGAIALQVKDSVSLKTLNKV
jgi:hypothetical protein